RNAFLVSFDLQKFHNRTSFPAIRRMLWFLLPIATMMTRGFSESIGYAKIAQSRLLGGQRILLQFLSFSGLSVRLIRKMNLNRIQNDLLISFGKVFQMIKGLRRELNNKSAHWLFTFPPADTKSGRSSCRTP